MLVAQAVKCAKPAKSHSQDNKKNGYEK